MDKTVLTVNRDQVRQIHIVRPHNPPLMLSLVEKPAQDRKDETEATDAVAEPTYVWQDGQGNPVSETKINNLLQTVSDLKCREFIEDTSEKSDPSPLITVTVNDGMEHTLKIFEKHDPEDTAYPAVSSETDHPFLLAQFTVEDILNFFVDETDPEEES